MIKKNKNEFNVGELVVYPKHGVGDIKSISILEISNIKTNIRIDKNITYSASCHNLKEIHMANQLNLDFILLSPVLSSKLRNSPLGWTDFKLLSKEANMPVFALGGISKDDLNTCMANDGYGVSGISKF